MRRSYPTQMGEKKAVGSNFGLPGNYGLYLVASGIVGLFFWLLFSLAPGVEGPLSTSAVLVGLLPPSLTAWVIFGFVLGKPPHHASDLWQGMGRRTLVFCRQQKFRSGGNPVRREEARR